MTELEMVKEELAIARRVEVGLRRRLHFLIDTALELSNLHRKR